MYINFQKVRFKNFLAVGNDWIEIVLDENPLTLVYGTNGAGKTTFVDAITFALFGRAFRNINKPLLVNTTNDSDCLVEIEFQIGTKQYKIVRGVKPSIFEIWCDNVLKKQTGAIDYQVYLEKEVLKFNFKSFKQIVVLGSKSFVPFMQLVAAERRAVIEDILYIQIFSSMAKTTKQKISVAEKEHDEIQRTIDVVTEKIALQNHNIRENTSKNQSKLDENRIECLNHLEVIATYKICILKLQEQIEILRKTYDQSILVSMKEEVKNFSILQTKINQNSNRLSREIVFFTDNDICPTCKQTIEISFKEEKITKHNCKQNEMNEGLNQLNSKIETIHKKIADFEFYLEKIRQHKAEIDNKQTKIDQLEIWIKRLKDENEKIKNLVFDEANSNIMLQQFNEQILVLEEKRSTVYEEKRYLEVASSMLKDSGIKTNIIKQYLPIINNYINSYLSFMDFNVNFTLNAEFEESIMSRHRDEFSYESFSDGQQLRIDLALLFAWRSVAKFKNSIDTNLLIMDEILDASLDINGVDEFFKLIRSMKDVNIFIISPKGELILDKFDTTIRFELKNLFSEKIDG